MTLGSKMAPPRGSLAPIDFQWENIQKSSCPKPHGPELSYFVKQCIVVLFINPANHVPGVHTRPPPPGGVMGKT